MPITQDAQIETTTDDAATVTSDATTTTDAPADDLSTQVEKWKALARKHEQQSKANADKAKRFDEFEEASKSDLERALARAEAAEKAASAASAAATRAEVAAAKGVPAHLLTGSTQEEFEASADALLAFKGTTPKAPSADGQGKVGEPVTGPKQFTRDDLKRMTPEQISDALDNGQLADINAGKA
jgi:hypothetical protein